MMNCRLRIAEQDSKIITEDDFDAVNAKDDDSQPIDYGNRKISRGPLESQGEQVTPFITRPLLA